METFSETIGHFSEILVLFVNYKNIVYVLDYESIVNVEYVSEMQV